MSLIEKNKILPFIDQLVNTLYTDEINKLLEKTCSTIDDKRIFLMFLLTYFFTHIGTLELNIENKKENLKKYLSEILLSSTKRRDIIDTYKSLEETIANKLKKLN